MALGLSRYESVSILGFNSPEWLIANVGAIAAGGFAAGIYTTNNPEQCQYIANHCKARVIVVEGQKQLDKILEVRSSLKELVAIVVYGGDFRQVLQRRRRAQGGQGVLWDDFMGLGKDVSDADLQARIDAQKPGECCTLIYTSGTTGNPKAVMISHDNVTWTTKMNLKHQPKITSGPLAWSPTSRSRTSPRRSWTSTRPWAVCSWASPRRCTSPAPTRSGDPSSRP